jgi:hypothetical protein
MQRRLALRFAGSRDGEELDGWLAIVPEDFPALICTHKPDTAFEHIWYAPRINLIDHIGDRPLGSHHPGGPTS